MSEKPTSPSLQHDDVPGHVDGAGASHEAVIQPNTTTTTTSLPLRQAMQRARQQPPREPRIVDITKEFTQACSSLQVGELIKDEYFTLFESIAALEIMDPKMDSGFLQPGETLEDAYDTLAPILPEELIGIMDQLLCYEMAWHTGYPLSQTLFTSVYIDKLLWPEPKTLKQAQFFRGELPESEELSPLLQVLRAYCLGLVKCCDFVIAKVTNRDYYEEEDFSTHTYHRTLFPQIVMDEFLKELDDAVETVNDPTLGINDAMRGSILARLKFRRSFLEAIDLELPLDVLHMTWDPVLAYLPLLATTQQLGTPVPGSFSTKIQRRLASTVPPRPVVDLEFKDAFEKLSQLCLDCKAATSFTNLPPDPLEIESFLWAFAYRSPAPLPYARSYMANILFHPDTLNTSTSLPLLDVQALVFPPHSPILATFAAAPAAPGQLAAPTPQARIAQLIDDFIERAGQSYLDYWTALGQNQCRLRRMLTHVVLSWNDLQRDAAATDAKIAPLVADCPDIDPEDIYPNALTAWASYKKLTIVEKIALSGFEQDIYLPDEYAGMYSFVSGVAAQRIALLRGIHTRTGLFSMNLQMKGRYDAAGVVEIEATMYLDSQIAYALGIRHLSAALSSFYTIALYLHLIPRPKRPFGTEELRYELRMRPYLTLDPPLVPPFSEYLAKAQPFGPFDAPAAELWTSLKENDAEFEMWKSIDEHVKEAKNAFARVKRVGARAARAEGVREEWEKGVNGLVASCVALGVAAVGLRAAVGEMDTVGEGEGNAKAGMDVGAKIELPQMGSGKRYAEAWVVGKVVKTGKSEKSEG